MIRWHMSDQNETCFCLFEDVKFFCRPLLKEGFYTAKELNSISNTTVNMFSFDFVNTKDIIAINNFD